MRCVEDKTSADAGSDLTEFWRDVKLRSGVRHRKEGEVVKLFPCPAAVTPAQLHIFSKLNASNGVTHGAVRIRMTKRQELHDNEEMRATANQWQKTYHRGVGLEQLSVDSAENANIVCLPAG